MRPIPLTAALVSAVAMTTAVPPAALAATNASGSATVSVFHGVPGVPVDVYANGKRLLNNFQPGTLTNPQTLPAGSYDIKIFKAGANPSGTPVLEKTVSVTAGENATIVAHLNATGSPVLDAYANNTEALPNGQARVTVRHDAAAPAVDVRANRKVVFAGLSNPGQASTVVPAGTVRADVVLAGTSTVAIGPASLPLRAGMNTIVYAWGSAADKNLALKVQTVPTGMRVNAGAGHAFSTPGSGAIPWQTWPALAGVGAFAGVWFLRRTRAAKDS